MRDCQTLLAEYVRSGSEEAFRELVEAYVGLVYSTALRLVGGDTHQAKDVAQTVFTDLARKASSLPRDVMLGGWLHRDTCFVASKLLRGERRRRFRERQAAEMNALNNLPDQGLAEIAPALDDAINELSLDDRKAILLRFFERLDLCALGKAVGISENAAQKRLSRALEKLQVLLTKRGITLSVAALATALSAEAVTACPAGLAASIAGVALTSASTAGATTITFAKILSMTTVQKALATAAAVALVAGGIHGIHTTSSLQRQLAESKQANAESSEQMDRLVQQYNAATGQLATLRENSAMLDRDRAELLKFRAAASAQRTASTSSAPSPSSSSVVAPTAGLSGPAAKEGEAAGRELGEAIVRREPGAIQKLRDEVIKEGAIIRRDSVGLTNAELSEFLSRTQAPRSAAMQVVQAAALKGNQNAFDAINEMAPDRDLQPVVVRVLGELAGKGNADALEILLDPQQNGFTNASQGNLVDCLRPAAASGNDRAINALVSVTTNAEKQALWYLAADGLSKAAVNGNAVAIDALIGLSGSATNQNVRNVVADALRKAAANQNAKAADALAAMGMR